MSTGFKATLILLSAGSGMVGFLESNSVATSIAVTLIAAGLLLGAWTLVQYLDS